MLKTKQINSTVSRFLVENLVKFPLDQYLFYRLEFSHIYIISEFFKIYYYTHPHPEWVRHLRTSSILLQFLLAGLEATVVFLYLLSAILDQLCADPAKSASPPGNIEPRSIDKLEWLDISQNSTGSMVCLEYFLVVAGKNRLVKYCQSKKAEWISHCDNPFELVLNLIKPQLTRCDLAVCNLCWKWKLVA